MARVQPTAPFADQFFGGASSLEVEAGSLFALIDALDRIGPGFAEEAGLRAAFAVDGAVQADWSAPLGADALVMVFPRVAGGCGQIDHTLASALDLSEMAPFGAEIRHDFSAPLTAQEAADFRAAFNRYGLILLRGQSLSMARQREICGLLGPILLREGEDGYMSNEGGGPSAAALSWHADAAYTDTPFDALSLHAIDVVDDASSTLFVSAQDAADTLPAQLAAALAGCEQEMISPHYTAISGRTCDSRDPESFKRGIFPTFRTNPHNGRRCLWTSELQTARLLGMEWEASRALLHKAFDHLYAPERVLEHRWRVGDIIIWDNIALQHARGAIGGVGKRLLQRVIVGVAGVAPHIPAG